MRRILFLLQYFEVALVLGNDLRYRHPVHFHSSLHDVTNQVCILAYPFCVQQQYPILLNFTFENDSWLPIVLLSDNGELLRRQLQFLAQAAHLWHGLACFQLLQLGGCAIVLVQFANLFTIHLAV